MVVVFPPTAKKYFLANGHEERVDPAWNWIEVNNIPGITRYIISYSDGTADIISISICSITCVRLTSALKFDPVIVT